MPKFKQTRPKQTGGFNVTNLTETRVIQADVMPAAPYLVTEEVGAASQVRDWQDDPAPKDDSANTADTANTSATSTPKTEIK